VAGDAALMVDPYKVDEIREAIRALDADSGLWAEMRERGLRRAPHFSMDTYRERMSALYESLT